MSDAVKTMVIIGGAAVVLLTGAVVALVMMARDTGTSQWYWAFQAVVSTVGLSALAGTIRAVTEKDG
jgi:hypothetical protein